MHSSDIQHITILSSDVARNISTHLHKQRSFLHTINGFRGVIGYHLNDVKHNKIMLMKTFKATLLIAVMALSGCAAMSIEECQTANWASVGERDGQNGRSNRIASYYKSCEKAGLVPNQRLYEQGYQKGLVNYCQPTVILDKSLAGSGSYSVCPVEKHSLLRPYYEVGSEYYDAKRKKESVYGDLKRYQDYLLDKNLSKDKRDNYINKVRDLKDDYRSAERDYDYADRALQRFKRDHNIR